MLLKTSSRNLKFTFIDIFAVNDPLLSTAYCILVYFVFLFILSFLNCYIYLLNDLLVKSRISTLGNQSNASDIVPPTLACESNQTNVSESNAAYILPAVL